ncbi:MAG: hypothetical protein H7Y37_02075 [Anaerolineae bacterium]|nr:hypothetical protein [Gloeobacterales cyanobacterium ES-bin-313]
MHRNPGALMSSEPPLDSTPPEFVEMPVKMGESDRRRVEGIAFLLASPDGASYRQRLREVSESLGISARSMHRCRGGVKLVFQV